MMPTSPLVFYFILASAAVVLAIKPLEKEVCTASCYYSLIKVKYAGGNETEQLACTNPLRVTSTYYCMGIHCEEADVKPGMAWWAITCKKSKHLINEQGLRATISTITTEELASLPTVDRKEKDVVNGTAVPSDSSWLVVHRSVSVYSTNREYNNKIRWIPYAFWAIVLLAGITNNALNLLTARRVLTGTERVPKRGSKVKAWLKAHLAMVPTLNRCRRRPWRWGTVPLRLQSMVVASYAVIHIAMAAVHYRVYDENYYYPTKKVQVLRYFGDRLGTLLSSALPLMFLFGGRGNIFIPLTGWSYRTFNIFHRWIARIFLIEVVLHGAIFSAYDVNLSGWGEYHAKLQSDEVYRYGIFMGVAVGLSAALAQSQIRKHVYEFFKATHVILAAIALAAFYEHVKPQFRGTYNVWEWLCVGIWCGDRVLRLIRILIINYKSFVGKDTLALASFSPETGMIRLQVYPSNMTIIRRAPGTYYHVSFPGCRFWESHPFSLAGWSASTTDEPAPYNVEEKRGAGSPQVSECNPGDDKACLTFMIRPRKGMTRRLRDRLQGQGQCRLRVLLEGPYGSAANLGKFDDILFLAGGSGITAALPYIRTLFERNDGTRRVPRVKLAWAARHEGFVQDVLANDLRLVQSSPSAAANLKSRFFITNDGTESESSCLGEGQGRKTRDARFNSSRPDIKSLVDGFLQDSEGRAAVFVCGPEEMGHAAREAVVTQLRNGAGDIGFFEALYGW